MCAIVGFPVAGSSPLTRGKPLRRRGSLHEGGLIPAHAGKTRLHYASRAMYRAHPRSRGENPAGASRDLVAEGSSPLTRGKPTPALSPPCALGLIPAHAGKTGSRTALA